MKIKDVKLLDEGTSGFSLEAHVLQIFEIKDFDGRYGAFKKQTLKLIDSETEETIFCTISQDFLSKEDVTKPISISDLALRSYKGSMKLEGTKKSKITIERTVEPGSATNENCECTVVPDNCAKTTFKTEKVKLPKAFTEMLDEAVIDVDTVLSHPGFKDILKKHCNCEYVDTEDARALLISRLIQKERSNY